MQKDGTHVLFYVEIQYIKMLHYAQFLCTDVESAYQKVKLSLCLTN
jgi:hypothetical protein